MAAIKKIMKPQEIYGFVGWVSSFIIIIFYFIWAFIPDETLMYLGITYYPSKHWSIMLPGFIFLSLIAIQAIYQAGVLIKCHPKDSVFNLQGKAL
jgi:hypothetical protein